MIKYYLLFFSVLFAGRSLLSNYKTSSKPFTFKDKRHALVTVLSFQWLASFFYLQNKQQWYLVTSFPFFIWYMKKWDSSLCQQRYYRVTSKQTNKQKNGQWRIVTLKKYYTFCSFFLAIINYINEIDERGRLYCHSDSQEQFAESICSQLKETLSCGQCPRCSLSLPTLGCLRMFWHNESSYKYVQVILELHRV